MRECTNKWIGSDEKNLNTRITVFPNSCESGVRFVLNLDHVLRIGMLTCTNLTTEKFTLKDLNETIYLIAE